MATTATMGWIRPGVKKVTWNLTAAENGDAVELSDFPDKTVIATSANWNAQTATIQQSNDGVNWVTAIDITETAITFAANGIAVIASNAQYIRAILGGSATVAVSIVCSKGR